MTRAWFYSLKSQFKPTVPYALAHRLQMDYVERRINDQIPDTFFFLEHDPVLTQGRGLQATGGKHSPVPAFLPAGVEFIRTERGGDLTYHGPGQLVVYFICKLNGEGLGPKRDIGAFLRRVEQVWINALQARGLPACQNPKSSGVWLGNLKVASLGVTVRKWVTFHGMALNVANSLEDFEWFSPCGLSGREMTRLADWMPLTPHWRQEWERELLKYLNVFCLGGLQEATVESLVSRSVLC